MTGTFADSWRLTKTSFRMIGQDRALLVFPLVAGLSAIGVIVLLLLGEYFLVLPLGTSSGFAGPVYALGVVLFVAAYAAMAFLSVYCTAALIGAATMKLNGQQPTTTDGWRIARAHLRRLVVWSLLTATVGLLIQMVASRARGIAGLLIGAVGGATWAVVTYFMIPVLLYENERPWPALKRSAHLFTSTFGRTIVSNLALGLLIGLGIVAAVALGLVGLFLWVGGAVLVGLALVGGALAIGVVAALFGAAAEGILRAALYRYATTGRIEPDLWPAAYGASAGRAPPAPLP
jgi:uncharacterized protein DUF6159